MDLGHASVPAELLNAIVQNLPVSDLKNVRLVCKHLAVVASQSLFQTVYISTQLRDRENLAFISDHPIFRHNVKEIVYDATYMPSIEPLWGHRLSKANYKKLFWARGYRLAGAVYSQAAIERGFNRYQASLMDQNDLAKYCGPNLTNPINYATLPLNFQLLLEDPQFHTAMAIYLPDDLVRLVEALPKMPNVRRFAVSDWRYTRNDKHYTYSFAEDAHIEGIPNINFSIQDKGIRGLDAVVLDPRPWPEPTEDLYPDNDRSWYRGFSVLMQAASMTNMQRLEAFNIDCDNDLSGLSHSILDMSATELHHATNAFRNLRTIKLKIDSREVTDCRPGMTGFHMWDQTLDSGSIAVVLSAATQLETLELELDDAICDELTEVPSFAALIGTGTWPRLRSLSLGHMALFENEFLEFFSRHVQTLQSLRLEQIDLGPINRVTHHQGPRVSHTWGNAFQSMAANNLALTKFDMHYHVLGGFDISRAHCIKLRARGADEVFQLFQSGGIKQKKKMCRAKII